LKDVIIVPSQAVFSASGEDVVYVMGHGAPQRRPIQIDRRNADRAVIRSGVTAGERVALKDPTIEVARR